MHRNAKDMLGQKFGRLTVVEFSGTDKWQTAMWKCQCDCGREVVVRGIDLRSGHTKSCGCQRHNIRDLTGEIFGRLTVVRLLDKRSKHNSIYWECVCDCGKVIEVMGRSLKSGHTKSCGCYRSDLLVKENFKHGMSRDPLNSVFSRMKDRCYNEKDLAYHNYGARGIYIGEEWLLDRSSFFTWAFNNGYTVGLEIDRIDNNGPYSPENCRWVTCKQNSRNKRNNHFLTFEGKIQTIAEWADEMELKYSTVAARIRRGYSIEKVLSTTNLRTGHSLKFNLTFGTSCVIRNL